VSRGDEFDDGYRMAHRPGDDGPGLHNVDEVYPGIHEHPEHYDSGMRSLARQQTPEGEFARRSIRADHETFASIRAARGNPEATVMMHRAVPAHVTHIHPGDWVTTSRTYAEMHNDSNLDGQGKILSARVPAKHLSATGDYIHEYGYTGPRVAG